MRGLESVKKDLPVSASYSSRTRGHQVKLAGQMVSISGDPRDDSFTLLALVVFQLLASY